MIRATGAVAAALLLAACSPVQPAVPFVLGVSQANLTEPWRVSMTQEIRAQAALHPDIRVIVADASDSLGKQILDVETFEGLGVDLLIISPLESEALTPTVTKAFESIPVIVLNRSVSNDQYTMFIGPDNARIGQEAGRYVAERLEAHGGTVLEILGRSGSPPTLERAQAFRDEIRGNPDIHLEPPILANWLQDGAEDLVADRLSKTPAPDVVFAHNDAMAYGAWLAARSFGSARQTLFVGVDGLPGPRGGQEMLRAGILAGTFLSPTGGREAVEYALAILHHQTDLPKQVILGTRFLTREALDRPVPKRPASGLRVGVSWSGAGGPWHQALVTSVRRALLREGWTVVNVPPGDLPDSLDAMVFDSFGQSVDAAAVQVQLERTAARRGMPVFRLGPQPPLADADWTAAVGPDPSEDGRLAGRWLALRRRTHVALLVPSLSRVGLDEERTSLERTLRDHDPRSRVLTLATPSVGAVARAFVRDLLSTDARIDAIATRSRAIIQAAADACSDLHFRRSVDLVLLDSDDDTAAWVRRHRIDAAVVSPPHLGPLLAREVRRAFEDPGVPRRLVTTYDVISRP